MTGNATTWSVPLRYKTVSGLNDEVIFGSDADNGRCGADGSRARE